MDSGLLTDRRVGTARLVRANTGDRLYGPTRTLIEATYGPRIVLESALAGVDGIAAAYIFGSWAARYEGEPGPAPNDLDVVVVGDLNRRRLQALASHVEQELHREVNIERVSPAEWEAGIDPFVATVRGRPLVRLELGREAA